MNRKVFIGCSSEAHEAALQIKDYLNSKLLSTEMNIWNTSSIWTSGDSVFKMLCDFTKKYYYAIFIYFPDDIISIRGKTTFTTRDNVIFESGLFLTALGIHRTFIMEPMLNGHPEGIPFQISTDFDGIVFPKYKLDYNTLTSKWEIDLLNKFTKENLDKVAKDISDKEKELRRVSNIKKIESISKQIESGLANINLSDEIHIGNFKELVDDLFRSKAKEIKKTIPIFLNDVVMGIRKIDEILDIEQLAVEQGKDKITQVWVFANEPLEFGIVPNIGTPKHSQYTKLRMTIVNNLTRGVKYVYFVNKKFNATSQIQSLIGNDMSLDKCIEIIQVDSKLFLTFFTIHFEHDPPQPTEIYVSLIDKNRDDLLVKVPESQKPRILENLISIKGHSNIESNFHLFDRAHSM